MFVSEFMSTRLVTVEMDDRLSVVKEILENLKIHHLLVIESQKVFGVISDRDLYKALSPNIGTMTETLKDVATLNKRVHQIMSRQPIVLTANATIDEAIAVFSAHTISCIPIVDDAMKPIGIVTIRNILNILNKRKWSFSNY